MGFFLGTQERVRNMRGKGTISIRTTESLLCIDPQYVSCIWFWEKSDSKPVSDFTTEAAC